MSKLPVYKIQLQFTSIHSKTSVYPAHEIHSMAQIASNCDKCMNASPGTYRVMEIHDAIKKQQVYIVHVVKKSISWFCYNHEQSTNRISLINHADVLTQLHAYYVDLHHLQLTSDLQQSGFTVHLNSHFSVIWFGLLLFALNFRYVQIKIFLFDARYL